MQKLLERRRKICLTFAKKVLKHKKFSTCFVPNYKAKGTGKEQNKFCDVVRRADRFQNSPLPYLTNVVNNQFSRGKQIL